MEHENLQNLEEGNQNLNMQNYYFCSFNSQAQQNSTKNERWQAFEEIQK